MEIENKQPASTYAINNPTFLFDKRASGLILGTTEEDEEILLNALLDTEAQFENAFFAYVLLEKQNVKKFHFLKKVTDSLEEENFFQENWSTISAMCYEIIAAGGIFHGSLADIPSEERELLTAKNMFYLQVAPIFVEKDLYGALVLFANSPAHVYRNQYLLARLAGAAQFALVATRASRKFLIHEEKVRNVFESLGQIAFEWDSATDCFTYLSDTARLKEIFGFDPPTTMRGIGEIIHPEDRSVLQLERYLSREIGAFHSSDYRINTRYGWVRFHSVGRVLEIDKEKSTFRLAGALSCLPSEGGQSQFSQTQLLDDVSDAVLVNTLDHRFVFCNAAFSELIGYSFDEVLTIHNILSFFPKECHAKITEENKLASTVRRTCFELTIVNNEGKSIPIEVNLRLKITEPEPLVISVIRDISVRKAAELEKQKIEQNMLHRERLATLGSLVSGIGHEINNPLTIALGMLEQLKACEEVTGSQKTLGLLSEINKTLARITKIVRSLRTYAHSSTMPQGIGQALDLNLVLKDGIDLFQSITRSKKVTLTSSFANDLPKVRGNQDHFIQVLLNLLTNALDAMETCTERKIHISTGITDEKPWLDVQDSGSGIPATIVDKIFDPFFTTKAPGKGTGLGLPLAQKLLASYDALLLIKSTGPEGTCFRVTFKLAQSAAAFPNIA